jgi:integrase
MARARTAPGTHGAVSVTGQRRDDSGRWLVAEPGTRPQRYRATTRYTDRDDVVRAVERYALTKGEARAKLNAALSAWDETKTAREVRETGTLGEAGQAWLSQVDRAKLSDKTKTVYHETWARCIEGTDLASWPLAEVNSVPVLRKFLQDVADTRGAGTAKTARSVLSGILSLAVDDGALTMNATRSIRPVEPAKAKGTVRNTRRALTHEQREHLLAVADYNEQALAADVSDLIAYMTATGVRISEALGQRWRDVDLNAGTVHVRGTKSKAADRVLALPSWMTERLRARAAATDTAGRALLFPSPGTTDRTKPRDRRNVARIFRLVLDEAGLPWATPHTLRRTVATLIHEAGMPVTAAQRQLGHANAAMTMSAYLARRDEPSPEVAAVL